ncbi:hypothetical protein CPB85DRAFT_1289751 [Mucidula mucida]|nr:hypothetical protein CPB85DRAFT_1289751 [Mucidula mucida]
MTTINELYTLTTLLPSTTFSLAYSLPLLFLSLLVTFSGTFFTLDRTRQFAPKDDLLPGAFDSPKRKPKWLLEGGIGGLAIGYSFGVHFSTFLALMIPALSSTNALTSKSFVAVWLLSSLVTTFLAGRWKYCALALAGISGGTLFALALSVIIHPSLLTRVVFISICMPILTIFCMLPLAKFQHASLRFATASMGAFGIVLSIAILAGIPAWENVWQRLWVSASIEWGTTQEKGLSAGFCLFLFFGMLVDFFLRKQFGECPDEKWDSYLANYAANLPNLSDRAGSFKPFTSAWDRIFSSSEKGPTEIIFPDDKATSTSSPLKLHKYDSRSPSFEVPPSPGFLKKARSTKNREARFQARMGRKNREAVKFRPLGELSSDSEEDYFKPQRPWLSQKASMASTTPTLVEGEMDYDSEKDVIVKKLGNVPEYSDYEEDLGSPKKAQHHRDNGKDVPSFIQRGLSSSNSNSSTTVAPTGAVPYTPSLMKALDRIAVAQKDAFNHEPSPAADGLPQVRRTESWDDFWKDVNEKNGKS